MPYFKIFLCFVTIILTSCKPAIEPKPVDSKMQAATDKIVSDPKNPKNYDVRAELYFQAGDKVSAIKDMRSAVELETDETQKSLRLMDIQNFLKRKN